MTRSRFVASAAACMLLAGCTAAPAVSPTPTPTPTFNCTPEAGGAAYECSQFDYEQMVAKDKLYAEAEAVYRKFAAEDERILRAGGTTEATPVLLETTTGPYLAETLARYQWMQGRDRHLAGGSFTLASIERMPGRQKKGSVVAIKVCVDLRDVSIVERGKTVGRGVVGSDLLYFIQDGALLKILGADGTEGPCR